MLNRSGNTTDNLCFRYRFRDVFSRFRCCVYNGTGPLLRKHNGNMELHVSATFQKYGNMWFRPVKGALLNMELIMFIRLNAAAFIKIFVIQVRCLFEGGVYLKFNLLFANNSMVTDHFNCKKQKHVLVLVLNFTICVLILLQYLMWNKVNIVHPISMSLSSSWSESKRYNDGCALSKSEPVHSKGFVPCLLRTCNCDRSNNRALPQGCRSLGQWIMSSTGRFNMQLERVFFITSVGSSAQESRIHSKMVLFGDNFKFQQLFLREFPRYPANHSF